MNNKTFRNLISKQLGFPNKAKIVPDSFEDWLSQTGDSIEIDHGGNWTPDKCEANHDRYDKEGHPFA